MDFLRGFVLVLCAIALIMAIVILAPQFADVLR